MITLDLFQMDDLFSLHIDHRRVLNPQHGILLSFVSCSLQDGVFFIKFLLLNAKLTEYLHLS
jgi:hypothetical protein